MHTLAVLFFVSTFLVLNSQALIVLSTNVNDVRWGQTTGQATATPPSPKWTNETTFAFLGVCATISCCIIGLAWSCVRRSCSELRLRKDVEIGMRPLQRFHSAGAKKVQRWKKRDRQAVREEQQREYAARVEAVIKIRQGAL